MILGTGIGIVWGSRLLIDALGKLLKVQWNTGNIEGIMLVVSLTLAFAALPAGAFAKKIGNRKAMLSGISVIIIIMVIMLSLGAHLPIVFLGVCAFSLNFKWCNSLCIDACTTSLERIGSWNVFWWLCFHREYIWDGVPTTASNNACDRDHGRCGGIFGSRRVYFCCEL